MGLSLVMSAALPEAFGTRGLLFAVAYVSIQVGRSAFVLYAVRDRPQLRRNFERILAWQLAAGALWLAGGMAAGATRELLWLVAVVVDYAGPVAAFWTPWTGRSRTSEWTIAGGLFSERCQLFVIIALGESILITGAALGDEALTPARVGAFIVAFAGSVALWWLYFDRAAAFGASVIASTADPGRLGRSAYTYFHIPIVAGIIVSAVGDELAIAHPDSEADAAATAVLLLGPALFLAGHALYKWALSGRVYLSRLVAIAALGALAPLGAVAPTVAVSTAAALVVISVAAYDTWTFQRGTDRVPEMVEEPRA